MNREITYGEKYEPAMKMTEQAEADRYFEECVQHKLLFGGTREEAEQNERTNLGYWAGYYDTATRLRVERLFRCVHPVFGPASEGTPTPEEAFAKGLAMGAAMKEGGGL